METAQINKRYQFQKTVKSLFAANGNNKGDIELQWDADPEAHCYVIQIKNENNKFGVWKHIDIVNDSKYTVTGLKPRTYFSFRIAVINKYGQAPWSEAVTKKIL